MVTRMQTLIYQPERLASPTNITHPSSSIPTAGRPVMGVLWMGGACESLLGLSAGVAALPFPGHSILPL